MPRLLLAPFLLKLGFGGEADRQFLPPHASLPFVMMSDFQARYGKDFKNLVVKLSGSTTLAEKTYCQEGICRNALGNLRAVSNAHLQTGMNRQP